MKTKFIFGLLLGAGTAIIGTMIYRKSYSCVKNGITLREINWEDKTARIIFAFKGQIETIDFNLDKDIGFGIDGIKMLWSEKDKPYRFESITDNGITKFTIQSRETSEFVSSLQIDWNKNLITK